MIAWPSVMNAWLAGLGAATLHASILVVAVLVVQKVAGRRLPPRWRSALWWLVIARLLLPMVPGAPWSAMNLFTGDFQTTLGALEADATTLDASTLLLLGLWALGAAGMAVLVASRVLRVRMLLKDAMPIHQESLSGVLDDCRRRMKVRTPITLWRSPHVDSPILMGLWKSRLILPLGAESFGERVVRDVFLHELAHVRRRDLSVSWIVAGLLVLHWFNPLLWLAAWRIRADRECACDALALSAMKHEERFDYGESLLTLLSSVVTGRRPIRVSPGNMPGAVGVVESRQDLRRRLTLIAAHRPRRRGHGLFGLLCMVVLATLLLPGASPGTTEITVGEFRPAAPSGGLYSFDPLPDTGGVIFARPVDATNSTSTLSRRDPKTATARFQPGGAFGTMRSAQIDATYADDP